jgi:hypothetical protein
MATIFLSNFRSLSGRGESTDELVAAMGKREPRREARHQLEIISNFKEFFN